MNVNKRSRAGVFIDGSNVMWGSLNMPKDQRWFIDFAKFKKWLDNKYQPISLKYYAILDNQPRTTKFKIRSQAETRLYARIDKLGYEVITKPLKYIKQKNGKFITKGDMDIEITMGIMQSLNDLDQIILVSGDSDYLAPLQLAYNQGKSVHIISFSQLLSWELRTFATANDNCDYWVFESIRKCIEYY
ncbi:MAG: NYN domain-containing protein [Candidatus Saccharibacteria bacterium]|nr:NYN domain-containing protein [Candidatus Saccharibacteria bacterium]